MQVTSTAMSPDSRRGGQQVVNDEDMHLMELPCLVNRVLAMRQQEIITYSYENYRQSKNGRTDGEKESIEIAMEPSWREQICEWAYRVVDHFGFSREMVAISLYLFDRFLAKTGHQSTCGNSRVLLLAAMTTLQLAIKINDPKKLNLNSYCLLSQGRFSPKQVEEMERQILQALDWQVTPPTALAFIGNMLLFLPTEIHNCVNEIYELARYISELSTHDSLLITTDASVVALAAILTAMDSLSISKVPIWAREYFILTLSDRMKLYANCRKVRKIIDRLRQIYETSIEIEIQNKDTQEIITLQNSPKTVVPEAEKD